MNSTQLLPKEFWANICKCVNDESLIFLWETTTEIREVVKIEVSNRQNPIQEEFHKFLSYQILSILPAVSNIVFLTDHDECLINGRQFVKLPPGEVSVFKTMETTLQFDCLKGTWMSYINNNEIELWNASLTRFRQIEEGVEKNIEILNALKKIHDAIINIFEASKTRDPNEDEIEEFNLIEGRLKRIAEQIKNPTVISFSDDCTFSIQINKIVDLVYQIPKEKIYIYPFANLIKDNSSLM